MRVRGNRRRDREGVIPGYTEISSSRGCAMPSQISWLFFLSVLVMRTLVECSAIPGMYSYPPIRFEYV